MFMCVLSWYSCEYTNWWIVMEGSSESNWQRSDSSRGLNSSFLDRNPRASRANTVRFSGDSASHDSGYVSVRKVRERTLWPHINSYRTQVLGAEDGGAAAGGGPVVRPVECNDVSLRQWLDNPERTVDALECLHIFSQIVDIVNLAHTQGIVVHNINSETSCLQSSSGQKVAGNERTGDKKLSFPMKQILLMESNWYSTPEEGSGGSTSCASDIYQLGVLLFELFCTFGSLEEKSSTMASLRHRVLLRSCFLSGLKKLRFAYGCCIRTDELLQSEFLNEPRNDIEEREAAIELREKIEEQELLLEFLLILQQRKQDAADSLNETISFISSDIEEATKLQTALRIKGGSESGKNWTLGPHSTNITDDDDSGFSGSRKRTRQGLVNITNPDESDDHAVENQKLDIPSDFKKAAVKPAYWPLARHSLGSSDGRGSIEQLKEVLSVIHPRGSIEFVELGVLLSFDRDGEFFATGVNKKIKVFEYNSIVNEDRDIHYPVVEMASRSKLSSICWNGYIKSQIASSNPKVWDVTRSQAFMEMREHERRVWSVDFSVADPTLLASGSDDGSVKLWNINQAILFSHLGVSVGTIKTKANVCCVQFPTDSGRTLAFGSADHRIYYYDLRNSKTPLCTLIGHNKTVSYVKFIDSTTLVSASTDNTLKLWDLSMCTSRVLDSPLQSFTGHLNLKNFVGLSVSEGYIATGSETNEVFVYHKAFPMPAMSFKFNSTDPFSGDEVDDTAQFISSVCWRSQSSTLVAANSMGNIKLLEMA
ncbi:hypothetical protein DH2020_033570 [Rehmannia glutinosa]|uniref:Uncharacterized protein n=1 Tax=Rehmannia glutinosa TaxID=99300 RepID=A0ABR0VF76_REHGL